MIKVRYNEKVLKMLGLNMIQTWRYRMGYIRTAAVLVLFTASLLLSACNIGQQPEPTPDVGMIFTEAAQTVSAQFAVQQTQTALAAPSPTQPPTSTSFPTIAVIGSPIAPLGTPLSTFPPLGSPLGSQTPLGVLSTQSGPLCDDSAYIADITYPDGEVVKGSKAIEKIWRVQNTGICTWDDGYALVHVAGDALSGKTWELERKSDFLAPGDTKDIGVIMITPSNSGTYSGCWRMRGDNGYYFGTLLCIEIVVE
jgi:hypothetical protein